MILGVPERNHFGVADRLRPGATVGSAPWVRAGPRGQLRG